MNIFKCYCVKISIVCVTFFHFTTSYAGGISAGEEVDKKTVGIKKVKCREVVSVSSSARSNNTLKGSSKNCLFREDRISGSQNLRTLFYNNEYGRD